MKFSRTKKIQKQVQGSDSNMKLYLSIRESVTYTGLSEYAIRKLVAEKAVPFLNAGRKVLIDRIALEKYLKDMSANHLSF